MGIQERKEREKARRRQQIIVAAKRVFSAKGFNKATMEDIANEAELSPGTIYLYFKNKDELYASLSLRILHYLYLRIEQLNSEDIAAKKKLDSLKDVLYDVYEFDPLIVINMFHLQSSETLKNLSPKLLGEIKELSQKALGIMANIFQDGIESGDFIDLHPVAMTDIAWALFSGIILWEESKRILNSDKDYLKDTLGMAFDVFSRGIKK